MLPILLAAAAAPSAVDAERAFARDAQRLGQWTAFAKWAEDDAVMFTPQAVWARDFLKGRRNPARSVQWWPAQSIVSCDGRTAVNIGAARLPGGSRGEFTTVWQRQKQGWRWVYDAGDYSKTNVRLPARPTIVRASCRGKAPGPPVPPPPALTDRQARTTPADSGRGQSADRTLGWDWKVQPSGTRLFRTYIWTGSRYRLAVDQRVAAE